eukprot:TRINITY_DN83014_c0_g1_i1.p1 TRINITY_DN83014_c0_g1~~TRINITY_DN83014_c0_g1_i1.p1  ORF type:complete len:442 (-),score=43.25 TRINITY_DN83014_c0_g1_i1:193-1518(-)
MEFCSGETRETGLCPNLPSCHTRLDCKFEPWEDWYYAGGCAGICTRRRNTHEFSNDYGAPCQGAVEMSKPCVGQQYADECPYRMHHNRGGLAGQDCTWGDWSDWSGCSRDCGGGEKSRDRMVRSMAVDGGAACEAVHSEELHQCNLAPCGGPCQDGRWGPWSAWEACSTSCGAGLQVRRREVEQEPDGCGMPAVGSEEDFRPCLHITSSSAIVQALRGQSSGASLCMNAHMQQACTLDAWSQWSGCDRHCGIGRRTRMRLRIKTTLVQLLTDEVAHRPDGTDSAERSHALMRENEILRGNVSRLETQISERLEEQRDELSKVGEARLYQAHLLEDAQLEDMRLRSRLDPLEVQASQLVQRNKLLERDLWHADVACVVLVMLLSISISYSFLRVRALRRRLAAGSSSDAVTSKVRETGAGEEVSSEKACLVDKQVAMLDGGR